MMNYIPEEAVKDRELITTKSLSSILRKTGPNVTNAITDSNFCLT